MHPPIFLQKSDFNLWKNIFTAKVPTASYVIILISNIFFFCVFITLCSSAFFHLPTVQDVCPCGHSVWDKKKKGVQQFRLKTMFLHVHFSKFVLVSLMTSFDSGHWTEYFEPIVMYLSNYPSCKTPKLSEMKLNAFQYEIVTVQDLTFHLNRPTCRV